MVVLENLIFKLPARIDIPPVYNEIRKIVDAQPGREAPVEGLAIDNIDRIKTLVGNQQVPRIDITVDEPEPVAIPGAFYHRLRMRFELSSYFLALREG